MRGKSFLKEKRVYSNWEHHHFSHCVAWDLLKLQLKAQSKTKVKWWSINIVSLHNLMSSGKVILGRGFTGNDSEKMLPWNSTWHIRKMTSALTVEAMKSGPKWVLSVGNFYKTQNYSDAFDYSHKKIRWKLLLKKEDGIIPPSTHYKY